MTSSPIQNYLLENLPLSARPWLVASLRQDKVVCQAATDLLTYKFSNKSSSVEDIQVEDWTSAALALRLIAPSISTLWLRTHPMPDLDDELKKQAFYVANHTTFPTEDWSLEKAGWIALAIRSDFYAKESWETVLDTWFNDPEEQHGTILACLCGMVTDPSAILRLILQRNPSAQNIAIVLHALLSTPLPIDSQFELLIHIVNGADNKTKIPVSARLVILHILQSQRPQLAQYLARHWLDSLEQFPTNIGWINQDPLTWFYDLQGELFNAATRHITSLEPSSVTIINDWKKAAPTLAPENAGLSILSDLVATARTNQLNDPQQAMHYGQKASQFLADFLKKIPNPLLADSRLVPLIQELSELFIALGHSEDSEKVLTLACELQPANANLLILIARSKQKSGHIDAAIQSLATALILSPARLDISTQLAETLETAGNWQAALALHQALLDEALTSNKPDLTGELYALANCALQANQPEKAIQVSQQLLEHSPENGMAFYFRGEALAQMNMTREALDSLSKATELSFDQSLPWLGLAKFHQRLGNQEQALATLQTAVQAIPENLDIHLKLGEIFIERHSYTQAQEALSLANHLAPTHPVVAYQYAYTLQQLGHLDTAKEVLYKALVTNPDDQELTFAYAQCLISLGENRQSLPYLESIMAKGLTNQVDPYITYAQVLLSIIEEKPELGFQPDKALEALEKAIQIDPGNTHALALRAEALAAKKDHAAALEAYQSVLDTPLVNDSAWSSRLAIGMGSTALALGKADVAIASLQDVIQNNPENSQPYRLLAEAYMAARLPENALRAAQSAISVRDEDPQTITWIGPFIGHMLEQYNVELSKPGNSYLLNHVLEDSIHMITSIIQARPDQIGRAINLSELQLLAGDQKAARQSLITIAHSDSAHSLDLIKAADHLFILDDIQAGISCLKRAVELETTNQGKPSTSILIQLARAYTKAGSLPLAQETFDQAIQLEPLNSSHYIAKSRLLLETRQTQQALECLQLALQNIAPGPVNPVIYYLIAYAYLIDGNLPAALQHARLALDTFAQSKEQLTDNTAKQQPDDFHPIAFYTLAAELSRYLLQPEIAQKYLQEGKEQLTSIVLDHPEYIVYYCLTNELSLEGEGKFAKNFQPPTIAPLASNNARLLSLNARLALSHNEIGQAQEYLEAACEMLGLSRLMEPPATTNVDGSIDQISELMAFADASIEIRDWNSALNSLRKASQRAHTNPLVHLTLVRFYTLQAEYQDLCESCSVVRHSPGPESMSESSLRGVRNALASMHDLINIWDSQLEKWEYLSKVVLPYTGKHALK